MEFPSFASSPESTSIGWRESSDLPLPLVYALPALAAFFITHAFLMSWDDTSFYIANGALTLFYNHLLNGGFVTVKTANLIILGTFIISLCKLLATFVLFCVKQTRGRERDVNNKKKK